MKNHPRFILLLFVVAAAVMGTSGYSVIQAERSSSVEAVDDDRAYLKIVETGSEISNGSTGTVLEVTNRFAEPVDLEVVTTEVSGGVTAEGFSGTSSNEITVKIGDSHTAKLEAGCSDANDGTISIKLTATGDSTSFETERDVAVSCKAQASS